MASKYSVETPFDRFLDSFTQELVELPADQALADIDREQLKVRAAARLTAAKKIAGQRRMARAKADAGFRAFHSVSPISIAAAKAYLSRVANDPLYTMAARNLEDLSDEEVLDLYSQIINLETKNSE